MDPFTIAMIGSAAASGIGAIGGIQSGRDASNAARAQNDIALRNYYMQQRIAAQQREMATAGSTDSRGNRVEYVPGVGWVERPTETTRGVIGASDANERSRLVEDATRGRMRRERSGERQINEGAQADAIMAGVNEGRETQGDLFAALMERNVARANSGADDMRRRIGLVSLRQGTSGQDALARLGRNALMDTRTAIAEARVAAPQEFTDRRAGRMNSVINQYNALASRATAPDDTPTGPTNLGADLSAAMRSRMNTAPQALGSAMGIQSPNMRVAEDRTPVAVDSLGQYLMGLGTMGKRNNWFGSGTDAQRTNKVPNTNPEGWG